MALTPELRSTQGKVLVTYDGDVVLRGPQAKVLVVYNLPAIQLRATQSTAKVVYSGNLNIRATQAKVLVLYSGRIDTPKIKTMGFNLDAHTFYCIRLGSAMKTLVYDKYTNMWSWWCREPSNSLDSHTGMNWRSSGSIGTNYGSNILLGDASNGNLYIMDPMSGLDSNANYDYSFQRVATGQMTTRGRTFTPIYSVYLTASLGKPALTVNSVKLEYSDDQGHTYTVADPVYTVETANYGQEFSWRSIGQIGAPGRLFRITDDGAFARIDALDVNI